MHWTITGIQVWMQRGVSRKWFYLFRQRRVYRTWTTVSSRCWMYQYWGKLLVQVQRWILGRWSNILSTRYCLHFNYLSPVFLLSNWSKRLKGNEIRLLTFTTHLYRSVNATSGTLNHRPVAARPFVCSVLKIATERVKTSTSANQNPAMFMPLVLTLLVSWFITVASKTNLRIVWMLVQCWLCWKWLRLWQHQRMLP